MPLDAEKERVIRLLNRLNDAITGPGCGHEVSWQCSYGLVVSAVDPEGLGAHNLKEFGRVGNGHTMGIGALTDLLHVLEI